MGKTRFGIDHLLTLSPDWKKQRLALVTNNAATTSDGTASRKALTENGFNLVRLFSPEHGLTATGEDGATQQDSVDGLTGLPVLSLYGDKVHPTAADLADIDIVLFDMPDAGCRFYTYIWTLSHVMESCAENNKPLILTDRPNPLGGDPDKTEGPMLDEQRCSSFIGRWNIPVRHSCTMGELARYFAATRIPGLQLQVIPLQNWNRMHTVSAGDWPFVPTSPAIQYPQTVLVYPATCFLEGVNVNEGRGTGNDFTCCGAPWINAAELEAAFNRLPVEGVSARACVFTPAWGLYAGEKCAGLTFSITDESLFRPVKTGLLLLQLLKEIYPEQLKERLYITVANPSGKGHLDRLTGLPGSFQLLETTDLIRVTTALGDWEKVISPFRIY